MIAASSSAPQSDPTRARAKDKDPNEAARRDAALDLLSQGYGLQHIIATCGFSSRTQARRALAAARKEIALDTAEEHRLNFKASYGPVRVALHAKARCGDWHAAEALVKLDERESRLFGLDLTPTDAALAVHYTKRIVIEDPAPATVAVTEGEAHG